ncbi:alpha/beta fold hydrolase [Nocardiopsis terrae]
MADFRRVRAGGTELETADWGLGEPLVFVQTALSADEFRPLAEDNALRDGYRKVLYHRRGYAGSAPARGAGSIERDARDCAALMESLGIERAHVLGGSYAGAVALRLAVDSPGRVHSLVLLEPPPTITSRAPEFRVLVERLIRAGEERGPSAVLPEFLSSFGWDPGSPDPLGPGSSRQMEQDAGTFFGTDLPALLDWRFGADDARRVRCPVLHVGGAESGPYFAGVREVVRRWFPEAEDVVIPDSGHAMACTHPAAVGAAVASFLGRHPMWSAPPSPSPAPRP